MSKKVLTKQKQLNKEGCEFQYVESFIYEKRSRINLGT